jgi:EAL domain-containing protein (putative c-di-GMP-specific phosphodiesterase class I)
LVCRHLAQTVFHALANAGLAAKIALDDFGTRFSSLSNLRTFHLDKIKIARNFAR